MRENLTKEHDTELINLFNPRQNSKYLSLGILSLLLAIILDFYVFRTDTLTIVYIPLMIMVGFLSRTLITNILLSFLLTLSLQLASPLEWVVEIFFLRWMGYFLIALVVRTLLRNNQKEQENLLSLTATLASSLDARDKYTSFHSHNVAYYSREIAKAMNLSQKECDNLYLGGLLHDFGKIGISESILNKPSRLTDAEFEQIKQHPQKGYEMLKHITYFSKNSILDMVLYHHEKFDGTGYPSKLKGEEIPLVARIMAVADAFDAMTSNRIYRKVEDVDYALCEISSGKHSHFDPEIADIFLDLVVQEKVNIRGLQRD